MDCEITDDIYAFLKEFDRMSEANFRQKRVLKPSLSSMETASLMAANAKLFACSFDTPLSSDVGNAVASALDKTGMHKWVIADASLCGFWVLSGEARKEIQRFETVKEQIAMQQESLSASKMAYAWTAIGVAIAFLSLVAMIVINVSR